MAEKKPEKKKNNVLLFAIGTVVALCVCMAAVLLVAFSLVTEGTYEIAAEPVVKTPQPQTPDAMLSYCVSTVNQQNDCKTVTVDSETGVAIENWGYTAAKGENGAAVMDFIKGDILSVLDPLYPENSKGLFGKEPDRVPALKLTAADVAEAECVVGQTDDEGNLNDEDYYFTTLKLNAEGAYANSKSGIGQTFGLEKTQAVVDQMKKAFAEIYKADSVTQEAGDFTVRLKTLRENDHIASVTLERNCVVTVKGTWIGKLSAFGANEMTFTVRVTDTYNYRYAGISFDLDEVVVEPGDSNTALSVTAVMNDDEDYTVSFRSEDESRVTLDELGYITGKKAGADPVTVTVTLQYMGNTFTDTCKVWVKNAAEKIKISQSKAELAVGETLQLSAKVTPDNATDKAVLWFTEGEDGVIAVDENGVVTALKAGTAKAVAVSKDGYFRDSCEITVKGGVK